MPPLAALATLLILAAAPAHANPGYALSFDGVSSRVTAPRAASNDFTISFWMCSTQTIADAGQWWNGIGVVDASVAGHTNDFGFALVASGRVAYGVDSTNGSYVSLASADQLVSDGLWHHVAATRIRTNGLVRFYVDGVLKGSANGSTHTLDSAPNLLMGCLATTNRFYRGQLDEVAVWSRALSLAEIQANRYRMADTNDATLEAYWRFDEGTGLDALDSSTNGQTGTLVDAPVYAVSGVPFIPDVTTGAASGIGLTNATLHGTVNACNLPTAAWFQWGLTTNYGQLVSAAGLPGTNSSVAVSATVDSLQAGQVYHGRLVASNAAGVVQGDDAMWTTIGWTNSVTSLSDDGGSGTLRQLVTNAFDGQTILLPATGMIALTNGEIVITNSLTFVGPGATNLSISGSNTSRVFAIRATNVSVFISDVTICDGKAANGAAGKDGANGGGIFNAGFLMLSHCVLANHHAGTGGAGAAGHDGDVYLYGFPDGFDGDPGGAGGAGGAIFNAGNLSLTACTICSNGAGDGGIGGRGERVLWTSMSSKAAMAATEVSAVRVAVAAELPMSVK